jgi:hypothetical protein
MSGGREAQAFFGVEQRPVGHLIERLQIKDTNRVLLHGACRKKEEESDTKKETVSDITRKKMTEQNRQQT